MKIRNKMLFAIGGSLVILLALAFEILILIATDTITRKLNNQLDNNLRNVTSQVSDLINTSARSYLTAIGLKSDSVVNEFYNEYQYGKSSFDEAYNKSLDSLSSFKFLDSGIVYVSDNEGRIIYHPDRSKIGTIAPVQAWIQRLKNNEKTFKFYEFQSKNKLVYRVYNPNFGYNILVDANTAEFLDALDLDDLNKNMNGIEIGLTGYPFILDSSGVYLTNPDKNKIGTTIFNDIEDDNPDLLNPILSDFSGNIEINSRFISFNRESNSELIICITGSVSEFYDTVNIIQNGVYILGAIALIIFTVVIFIVSSTITIPIKTFNTNLYGVVHEDGDLTKRINLKSSDEIGDMVGLFNSFLDTLQGLVINIKKTSKALLSIKNNIIYRINESSSSVKKILSNISSIKNQAKQLDIKVDDSLKSTLEINKNINSFNKSISNQVKVINTTSTGIKTIVNSVTEIEELVARSIYDSESVRESDFKLYVENSKKSFLAIKNRTAGLHQETDDLVSNMQLLKEVTTSVTKRAVSIKKQSDDVDNLMIETKNIASYVVDSMDMITSSSKKITNSMDILNHNATELENYGDQLKENIDMFNT